MGAGAYQRGSRAIAAAIEKDYLAQGGQARLDRSLLRRAELMIDELDTFSRSAQDLFVDACDPATATGLVKSQIYRMHAKKKGTEKFRRLHLACVDAHCAWVDSDVRFSVEHLQVCRRKARAWLDLLHYLNGAYRLPFPIPSHI